MRPSTVARPFLSPIARHFRALFPRYPFLLPNLAVALVAFVSLPFVLFILPETLRVDRGGVDGDKGAPVENRR